MNYGKKEIDRKIKTLNSSKRKVLNKIKLNLKIIVVIVILTSVLCTAFSVVGIVRGLADSAPKISEESMIPDGYPSTVYDSNGNKIQTLMGSNANRVYKKIEDIPICVQNAFIAIEDARFYKHSGVDLQGIIRALYSSLSDEKMTQGASTITQQLLKNQIFGGGNEKTFFGKLSRKIQEQCLAIRLENNIGKKKILEYYLNTINLGQNTMGVETASRRYFNKSVSKLNVSEAAVLAGITQNPTEYNPITNQQNNEAKRKIVLKNMLDQKYITEDEYEDALGDDVYSRIKSVNEQKISGKSMINSYYVDAVIDNVISDLKQKLGYTETQAYNAIYREGLKIYTCQDGALQKICDDVINDDKYYPKGTKSYLSYELNVVKADKEVVQYTERDLKSFLIDSHIKDSSLYFKSKKTAKKYIKRFKKKMLGKGDRISSEIMNFIKQPQASFVLMEQDTGKVRAIVGGRGEKKANRTLNRATYSKRQPGSTFKILTAYAPALDSGSYTLATTVLDEPITYSSGQEIHNADGKYRGYTSIREAIQDSVNVVAVKTVQDITPQAGYEMAKKFGISTLTKDDIVESLPLGVGGVTNLELAAAFEVMPNQGVYKEPVMYTKILDQDGHVLLEKKPKKHRVINDSTAFLLTSAMQDVVLYGTGKLADFGTMPIAGKTGTAGTSEAARDAWFAGYTPYYTCVVWGGYDDYSRLESSRYPKILWNHIMKQLHEGLAYKEFEMPEDVEVSSVCKTSGKIAIAGVCPETETEYFAEGTEPSEKCDLHQTAVICKDSGLLAGEYCPESSKETKTFMKKGSGEDKMPTEVCNVHTGEGWLNQLIQALTPENNHTGQ